MGLIFFYKKQCNFDVSMFSMLWVDVKYEDFEVKYEKNDKNNINKYEIIIIKLNFIKW